MPQEEHQVLSPMKAGEGNPQAREEEGKLSGLRRRERLKEKRRRLRLRSLNLLLRRRP